MAPWSDSLTKYGTAKLPNRFQAGSVSYDGQFENTSILPYQADIAQSGNYGQMGSTWWIGNQILVDGAIGQISVGQGDPSVTINRNGLTSVGGTISSGGPNRRIVIDGANNRIEIYDENSDLVGLIYGDNFKSLFVRNLDPDAGGLYIDDNNVILQGGIGPFGDKRIALSVSDDAFNTNVFAMNSTGIGFFDNSPVVQQTGGAYTAGATYGTDEQYMLNAVYSALQAYSLLT